MMESREDPRGYQTPRVFLLNDVRVKQSIKFCVVAIRPESGLDQTLRGHSSIDAHDPGCAKTRGLM